jgi:hypothetical protein
MLRAALPLLLLAVLCATTTTTVTAVPLAKLHGKTRKKTHHTKVAHTKNAHGAKAHAKAGRTFVPLLPDDVVTVAFPAPMTGAAPIIVGATLSTKGASGDL